MTKIKILPEQLANQIAAGEVVERPASVVKELVENSLDSGASRIEVEIEGGGTRLIRVIDDGVGMVEDDLLLSLERHGTSKIKNEEDLGAIATLGFRGEALPSIGSVSKLTLISRVEGADLGTKVALEYGRLVKVHEIGSSFGTTVEVRSLFGNTPARRKFLRTARTEIGHIEEVLKNYALGTVDVSFVLRLNGRESIYMDQTMALKQRLRSLLRYDGPLISVNGLQRSHFKRTLSGYLVPPEKTTSGPARLRIFVNNRAVRDRMVGHAVIEGLRGYLMKGKHPSGLIKIELAPEEIDVNVHPAKHEIRFRNSREVHEFIATTIKESMMGAQQSLKSEIFTPKDGHNPIPTTDTTGGFKTRFDTTELPDRTEQSPVDGFNDSTAPHAFTIPEPSRNAQSHTPQIAKGPDQPYIQSQTPVSVDAEQQDSPLLTAEPLRHRSDSAQTGDGLLERETDNAASCRHNLLVIGQFDDLYIFCKNRDGLVVIDQHAAHERLLYEKLRKQFMDATIVKQTLMFPETVELSIFQAQLVEQNSEELEQLGFTIEDFGGNTFIVSAVPALGGGINGRELLLDVLKQFGSEGQQAETRTILDNILADMACKAAVKAGTNLSRVEIDKLLDEMVRADLFSHCPHGRPVVKQITREELKKWFHRT